ncbi:MAG: hypothetical protein U0790_05770 [Isosphaeraceae bacterium]
MAADWNPRANDLFLRASEIDSPEDRRAFLETECEGDAELLKAVQSLLDAREHMGSFLEADATSPPGSAPETAAYRPISEGPAP